MVSQHPSAFSSLMFLWMSFHFYTIVQFIMLLNEAFLLITMREIIEESLMIWGWIPAQNFPTCQFCQCKHVQFHFRVQHID